MLPREWRRPPEPRRTWRDIAAEALLVAVAAAVILAILQSVYGCSPATTERAACSAVGATLNAASERIIEAYADDLSSAVGPEEVGAVEDRWAPILAGYESAVAGQNAWADAIETGQVYPVESVRAVYCSARAGLAPVSPLPDWPMGGCP